MPTTSNFGWTTPADTDLVKDGAAAIRTLGNGIDTSLVDLKGGTTGQILSKASNADLDYTWINNDQGDITEVAAGTGISGGGTSGAVTITNSMATAIDAKGDLIVGTGADTFSRLAVGTNGHTLVADSSTSTGLAWIAPAAAGFVGCYLYNSAAQSVDNAANFVLTFNSESFDTDAFHSTSTNTSRITIPSGKGGKYLFSGSIVFASNSTGRRALKFAKNATTFYEMIEINASSAETAITASLIVDLVATDYMEMIAGQTSGGGLNANGGVATTKFQAVYLGA